MSQSLGEPAASSELELTQVTGGRSRAHRCRSIPRASDQPRAGRPASAAPAPDLLPESRSPTPGQHGRRHAGRAQPGAYMVDSPRAGVTARRASTFHTQRRGLLPDPHPRVRPGLGTGQGSRVLKHGGPPPDAQALDVPARRARSRGACRPPGHSGAWGGGVGVARPARLPPPWLWHR